MKRLFNLLLAAFLVASMVIPVLPQREVKAWADASYPYRMVLSGNMTGLETLTSKDTLVHLTASNFNFALIGNGIAFYDNDDATLLPFEIDSNNITASVVAQDLSIWVGKTWQGNSNYSDYMYLYYGKVAGTLQSYNPKSVWDSNYVVVSHDSDNLSANTRIEDSTNNSNNATKLSAGNPIQATGLLGQSQNLTSSDSINYGINVGNSVNFTFEALIKPTAAAALSVIGSKFAGGNLGWAMDYATDKKLNLFLTNTVASWDYSVNSTNTAEFNEWSYATMSAATRPLHLKTHGGSATYNNQIYLVGGEYTDPTLPLATVLAYDPSTDTYTQKASLNTATWGGSASVVGTKMYYMAGNTGLVSGNNSNQEYDFAGDTWTNKAVVPDYSAHQGISTSVYGGKIYAFYQTHVDEYDPVGDGWTAKTSSTANLTWSSAFTIGDYIYLIGGAVAATGEESNLVRRYDPVGDSWDDAYDTIPAGSEVWAGLKNTQYDASTIYWGFGRYLDGATYNNRKTFYLYTPVTKTWTAKTSGSYEGNAYFSGIVGDNLYAIGYAFLNGSLETATGYKQVYSISGNSWTSESLQTFSVMLNGQFNYANSGNGTHRQNTPAFYIGNFQGGASWFSGFVDEVRFSNIMRSADWQTATWMMINNNFLYYGSSDPAPSVTTKTATGVSMDKDGVTACNVTGNVTDLGGSSPVTHRFNYGLTVAYGANTTDSTSSATGNKTATLPTNLIPGQTYHFRIAANNTAGGLTNGSDATFDLTLPTVTTGTYAKFGGNSAILNGNVTNMGVATDTWVSFDWGYTAAYGSSTTETSQAAIGSYTKNITYDPLREVHYRAVTRVGTIYSYGSDQTIPIDNTVDTSVLFIIPLGLLLIVMFASGAGLEASPISIIVVIIVIGTVIQMLANLFTSLF